MTKIKVENLTKVFGKRPRRALKLLEQGKEKDEILKETGCTVGVNRTNFSVQAGEIFVIMGLSGSGKSTLVRLLNRLIDPTEGSVWVDGNDLARMDNKGLRKVRREQMSMVFQQFGLFPFRTILDNVAYGLEIQGMDDKEQKEKAEEALQLVGLGGYGNMYPDELSGGMQQRVGLARALATDTDILLMDEAFSALDPLIRKEMQDELLQLQERMKKTIVFITHDLDEALRLGDRISIMKDGRTVQIGTPEDILEHPADDYVARFVQDVDRSKVFTVEAIMKRPEVLTIDKEGPRVALQRMKKEGISSLYVTNKERILIGIVHADDVSTLVKNSSEDIWSILHEDVTSIQKDTVVKDMIELLTYKNTPVAVVDEENRLVGIVVRGSVMALLSGKGGEGN